MRLFKKWYLVTIGREIDGQVIATLMVRVSRFSSPYSCYDKVNNNLDNGYIVGFKRVK